MTNVPNRNRAKRLREGTARGIAGAVAWSAALHAEFLQFGNRGDNLRSASATQVETAECQIHVTA